MAANWSINDVLAQLDGGRHWTGSTITYAFPRSASGIFSQGEAAGFRPAEGNQVTLMTLALATWDDLIPQRLVPGAEGSSAIEFGYTSTNIGYAHAYYPTNGSAWFNVTERSLVSTSVGQYGFQTFVHEIGHALGLNHMGDYNGDGNWSPSSFQDSVVLSIMSYFGPRYAAPNYSSEVMQADWQAADGVVYSPQTPMLNDVMAIQAIYGTATDTRSGDTVYGFGSNAGGPTGSLYDFRSNPNPILTIFDGGGNDTLDLGGWSTPSRVDLRPGSFSSANAMTNNIAIAYNTTLENAVGGGGSDVLGGNDADNRLSGGGGDDELDGLGGDDVLAGGPGNDRIDGGAGSDTATFEGRFASYTITVNGNSVTISGAASGTDTVTGVERFQFADVVRTLAELVPGADSSAPVLQRVTPADNAGGVALGADLVLQFDEAIKAGDGELTVHNSDGTVFRRVSTGDTTQVRFDGNRMTVDLSDNLVAGRGYYVNLSPGAVSDLAGNAHVGLTGTTAWNFTTAASDTQGPRVVALTPSDDAGGVAPGASLSLQFDEAVSTGTGSIVVRVNGQVFETIPAGDGSRVVVRGAVVTIDPAGTLPAGASVSVTVDASAFRDAAGNAFAGLVSQTAWNFAVATGGDDYPFSVDTPGVVTVGGAASTGVIEVGGDYDLFRVQLTAGATYTFTLTRAAGGLSDPYLALFDPQLDVAAEDDDSAGAGNSRIGYTAPASGTYYLAVLDYADTGTGAYSLSATVRDTEAPRLLSRTPTDDGSGVAVGADLVLGFSEAVQRGSGSIRILDANGAVLRDIRVSDTTAVHIDGSTVTVDPGDNLPDNAALVVNVDAGAFRDAAGNRFGGVSGLTAWNFRTAATSGIDDFPLSVATTGVVGVNGPAVNARIDNASDGDLFRVSLQAGVTYRFDMMAPTSLVDPFLALYGTVADGVPLIAYDDDSGPQPLDSRLYFTPSSAGQYYLAAFDYDEATGAYSVSATAPADDYLGAVTTAARLQLGGNGLSGRIGVPSDVDMVGVGLVAGRQYTFDLRSNAADAQPLDPFLVLLDASGLPLALDDDTGVDLDAQITFTAPASGTYFLAASDFDTGTGSFALSGFQRTVFSGSPGSDNLVGGSGPETLDAGAGNDRLRGNAGDDILLGGVGIDTSLAARGIDSYLIEHMETGWVLLDDVGNDGRDLLYDVERIQFADGQLWAIDVDGAAGTTVKILGAVFGAEAAYNEAFVGIGLDLFDGGLSTTAVVQMALDAALGTGASNAAVVNLLYANLFGSLPDVPTRQTYEGLLSDGSFTPAGLALAAAESEWNLLNIDFATIWELGIGYI